MDKTDPQIHKDFIAWWKKEGYGFIPETEEEEDWCNVVKYWAWNGYRKGRKDNSWK